MHIVDAFWEERNLGVTCYEIEMELAENYDEAEKKLDNLIERQYMVAKIPSSRYDLVQLFQSRGYKFIEMQIKLEVNFKKLGYKPPNLPDRLKKICSACSWGVMNETDLIRLSSEIRKNMFTTDRIYIDPKFTEEQAAKRYDLWIKDLIKQGNIPHKVNYYNETIGFYVTNEIAPNVCHGIFAGVYKEYDCSGMGYINEYGAFMAMVEQGTKKCVTHVSGNNPKILKLHTLFGYEIKGLTYVFIKHTN